MSDRFDFEQEILECWKVTNDIELWAAKGSGEEEFKVLVAYYNTKFQKMWDTFEELTKAGKIT